MVCMQMTPLIWAYSDGVTPSEDYPRPDPMTVYGGQLYSRGAFDGACVGDRRLSTFEWKALISSIHKQHSLPNYL